MSKKYRVTAIGRIRFSMDIEAESESEAKREFDTFLSCGGMNTDGVNILVEEIKKGGAK